MVLDQETIVNINIKIKYLINLTGMNFISKKQNNNYFSKKFVASLLITLNI